ncbi:CDP-alcohol phosphatidyltransferase family protein [Marinimicrococcus flavescens]|uniref:CDP-alcohol phosphatidyltransferase family protein n=1 Tax=Marinimicrococcus flavescens TaxID=3031815 RepID=A0AAP3XTJ6_9PROT|nr:CDP-alcohol phosphatidyltransferase family protein [Marinimicrococcus flavescens]
MTSFTPSVLDAAGAAALPALVGLAVGLVAGLSLAAAGTAALAGAGAVGIAFHRRATTPFGLANTITTARLVLALLLLALLVPGETPGPDAWLAVSLAGSAALLDGIDGWIARRLGQESRFGARLDMETDTVLMIVVSMVLAVSGKAGPWIMLTGLWRPLFVIGGRLLPWLARPLPDSLRRKTCCALPILLMTGGLAPVVPAGWAMSMAALALAAVTLSFALDGLWLWRRRGDAS